MNLITISRSLINGVIDRQITIRCAARIVRNLDCSDIEKNSLFHAIDMAYLMRNAVNEKRYSTLKDLIEYVKYNIDAKEVDTLLLSNILTIVHAKIKVELIANRKNIIERNKKIIIKTLHCLHSKMTELFF